MICRSQKHMADTPNKPIFIIAGPNGAGKTTFARRFLTNEFAGSIAFFNADEIAAELCPEAPETVAIRAGRMMLDEINSRVDAGTSFALETTLSGKAYARAIPKWRAAGYEVTLFFLSLPNPEGSIRRVAARVAHGGHHIPDEVIRRRFDIGLKNFYTLYRDLVDHWYHYDNSQTQPQLIDSGG